MFESFLGKIRLLIKGPMGLFVYAFMTKWYLIIAIPAIIVVFWVITGLTGTGILSNIETVVVQALNDSKSVARYCIPKILNLGDFWDCLQSPPEYQPTPDEVTMENTAKAILDVDKYNTNLDPYSDDQ